MSRIAIWWQAARPKTLWAGVAPVLVGTGFAASEKHLHLPSAVAALIGSVLIQIGTNFCNDLADFLKGADRERVGPVRATAAGLVSPREMLMATVLVFLLSAIVCAYLVGRGGWPVLAIGVVSILCGVLYTAGPKPLAYVGLGDLFVLIFFGPVAVAGTYYVQSLDFHTAVAVAGLGPGLLSVAILIVNNLRDIEGDGRVGKRTLAVRFGVRFSQNEYTLCIVGALIAVPLALVFVWGQSRGCLAAICPVFSALPPLRRVWREQGSSLNPALGGTAKVLLLYGVFLGYGLTL